MAKYKEGDIVVYIGPRDGFYGERFEIVSIAFRGIDTNYKVKGDVYDFDFTPLEQNLRPLTKLEKAMK